MPVSESDILGHSVTGNREPQEAGESLKKLSQVLLLHLYRQKILGLA